MGRSDFSSWRRNWAVVSAAGWPSNSGLAHLPHLARPASQPVLAVHYHSVDGDGIAVEAGQTLFAADAVQLTVRHDH